MPKEIVNKTKKETYPIRELIASNGAGYKCLPVQVLQFKICSGTHCGDEIFWNTHKKFIYPVRGATLSNGASCTCKKIWVDGCEDYIRIGGKEEDRKVIKK